MITSRNTFESGFPVRGAPPEGAPPGARPFSGGAPLKQHLTVSIRGDPMKSKNSENFKILVFGAINPQITTQYLQAQSQGVKHKNFHKYPKKTENIGVFPFGGAYFRRTKGFKPWFESYPCVSNFTCRKTYNSNFHTSLSPI